MVTPEWPDREVDEQFARIVAGWQQSAPTSGSAELAREDVLDGSSGPMPPDLPAPAVPSVAPEAAPPTGLASASDDGASDEGEPSWRGYRPAEVDEHFEPPDPRVPSARDATYWLSVVGLAGGPVLAIWAAVLSGNPDPGWLVVLGVLVTFAGFGLLVMRGSIERDPGDTGARV